MTHPLDPLSADEIRAAAAILRAEGVARPDWRIATIALVEPRKDVVAGHRPGHSVLREAAVTAWNLREGTVIRAVVSLTGGSVLDWAIVPGVQPNVTVDEWHECDAAMRAHPDVVAALRGRGIDDPSLTLVDVWTYGADAPYPGRVGWCDVWLRAAPGANPYAHPVAGLKLIVDLNTMELREIVDRGDPGRPEVTGEYTADHTDLPTREPLRPLHIHQPDGPSFALDGYGLTWANWNLRVGFTPREGLVLHQLRWDERPVAHRLGFAEMVVPYRDPTPEHADRTAFDIGEWGLGFMTTSLTLGCDCLGEIRYLDACVNDSAGEPVEIPNAICLHEEDDGVLWKHVDGERGAEVRRSRRLVISSHVTVANYDYLIYWRLYLDGRIECEVRATGIMVTTPFVGEAPEYGTVVDTRTYAPIHQHFIVARLDLDVDGERNTVVMSETELVPDDPTGMGLRQRRVPLRTEQEGIQDVSWATQRTWKVVNPERGTAYTLVPGAAIPPLLPEHAPVLRRARAIAHQLWVTPFARDEQWPCGEFVVQSAEDTGLPEWTAEDRGIENEDVVLWYVFGIHHVPRPEDWPVMPVDTVRFDLKPTGFFRSNPALDLPG
ncbi:primary-amine oxidase [Pseudonocardia oroxyli]|uniref:Amine oxidase n=1 Tax=Pseudonocardia oroxyli TaxID=366584 RepID=A0A1G7GQ11_PSEOR|nr:primary-amine oxidase [Pseudonocardia oroxyli]SDE90196.1 primary-amine oxidase [Pseudonocardia oroxyli]